MNYHNPVLLHESIDALSIKEDGVYVDVTYGGGWFLGKRVFSRWKLILLVVIGTWSGVMLPSEPYFAVIFSLLMIWDLTKK